MLACVSREQCCIPEMPIYIGSLVAFGGGSAITCEGQRLCCCAAAPFVSTMRAVRVVGSHGAGG